MRDYLEAVQNFSVTELEKSVLDGSLSTGLNACTECCDRWSGDGAIALEWYGTSGARKTVGFSQMCDDSARFANYLRSHGIGAGGVVAVLLPRIPDLFTVVLGNWRVGAIYQPLSSLSGAMTTSSLPQAIASAPSMSKVW